MSDSRRIFFCLKLFELRQIRKVFCWKFAEKNSFRNSDTSIHLHQCKNHNPILLPQWSIHEIGLPEQRFFVRLVRILEREFIFCSILGWSDNKKLFTIDVFLVRAWKLKVNLLLFYLACSYNSCSLNSELKTEKKILHQAVGRVKQKAEKKASSNRLKWMTRSK